MDFLEYTFPPHNSNLKCYHLDQCISIQQKLIKCLRNINIEANEQKDPPNNISECQEFINKYNYCIKINSIISSLQR